MSSDLPQPSSSIAPLAKVELTPAIPVSLFKKKSKKSITSNIRKRAPDTALEDEAYSVKPTVGVASSSSLAPTVKSSKRRNRRALNPLLQGTGSLHKRRKENDEESSDEDEDEEDEDEEAHIVKRGGVAYQAQGSARQQAAAALAAAQLKPSTESLAISASELPPDLDDGLYRGTAALKHQLPKGSAKYGPIKSGPDNVRTITVVDYQPDVCKDYKDTGFCGFGDTCKFLHDRGDYMHGWQLDDAFSSSRGKGAQPDEEEEEEVPFACLICRQPFNDPIVTKCQHYFCSGCAIKRFTKTPKCFACGAPTGGIFNKASKIIEKMKAKQDRIKAEKDAKLVEAHGLDGIEGLEEAQKDEEGSERSFYEDE